MRWFSYKRKEFNASSRDFLCNPIGCVHSIHSKVIAHDIENGSIEFLYFGIFRAAIQAQIYRIRRFNLWLVRIACTVVFDRDHL